MPIDTNNLIEQKEVAANIFACLYQRYRSFELRLCHADGSVVNPLKTEFRLQCLTQNRQIRPGGGGKEVTFTLLMPERYSLRLHGKEVWSYGREYLGLSEEEEAQRERKFNACIDFMRTHAPRPRQGTSTSLGTLPRTITGRSENVRFIDHGDMGVPWDPELFLTNNFPQTGCSSPRSRH